MNERQIKNYQNSRLKVQDDQRRMSKRTTISFTRGQRLPNVEISVLFKEPVLGRISKITRLLQARCSFGM